MKLILSILSMICKDSGEGTAGMGRRTTQETVTTTNDRPLLFPNVVATPGEILFDCCLGIPCSRLRPVSFCGRDLFASPPVLSTSWNATRSSCWSPLLLSSFMPILGYRRLAAQTQYQYPFLTTDVGSPAWAHVCYYCSSNPQDFKPSFCRTTRFQRGRNWSKQWFQDT